MSASKRMMLAFASTLLGVLTIFLFSALRHLRYGWYYVRPDLEVFPLYLLIALAGSIVALPLVLAFKSGRGVQGWLTLFIGTAIGPALMWGWASTSSNGHINWKADEFAFAFSALIAFLTSFFYILLLRKFAASPLEAEGV